MIHLMLIGRICDIHIVLRVLKKRPKLITNHIRGNLTATHRPANKGTHKVLSIIEHKLIARPRWNHGKSFKGVATRERPVAWHFIRLPIVGKKQRLHMG